MGKDAATQLLLPSRFALEKIQISSKWGFTNGVPCAILYLVRGALAQLVAHNTGSVGVRSSSLLCSTKQRAVESQRFFVFACIYWAFRVSHYPCLMTRGSGEKRSPVSDAGIHPVSALARLRETAGSLSNEQPMLRTLLRACGKQASFYIYHIDFSMGRWYPESGRRCLDHGENRFPDFPTVMGAQYLPLFRMTSPAGGNCAFRSKTAFRAVRCAVFLCRK